MHSYHTYIHAGLEIDIPNVEKRVLRAQLLCAIVDLPAKAALMNCVQYNGQYGCSTCIHPGCSVSFLIVTLYPTKVSNNLGG